MIRKIGILTHPLINNYGGILQAFALQTYLQGIGFEVLIIDRRHNRSFPKRLVLDILTLFPFTSYGKMRQRIQKMTSFINRYIHRTNAIYSNSIFIKLYKEHHFDAIIVGSDQVWRADFATQRGGVYFLDFIPVNSATKKIAYAASLGHDDWRYTPEMTTKIQRWIADFTAVSVREDSAVELCRNYMHVEAEHVLDPAFLLSASDYEKLASARIISDKYIFAYWLGDRGALQTAMCPFMDKGYRIIEQNLQDNETQMSIEDWLSYIKYADRVVTDSFHGCVFSLIFHKQLAIHANVSGGTTRLISLFKMLGIDRMFDNPEYQINYAALDEKLNVLRDTSKRFLSKALDL